MNKKGHKKLSDVPYTGEKKTITQSLTPEEIKDLLDGYEQTTFENLKPFFHVRYYKQNPTTKEVNFRVGGIIILINSEKEYIIVSSGTLSFCVQKQNTIFFQAVPLSIMKERMDEQYKKKINEQNSKINELMTYIKSLEDELKDKNKIIDQQKDIITKIKKK